MRSGRSRTSRTRPDRRRRAPPGGTTPDPSASTAAAANRERPSEPVVEVIGACRQAEARQVERHPAQAVVGQQREDLPVQERGRRKAVHQDDRLPRPSVRTKLLTPAASNIRPASRWSRTSWAPPAIRAVSSGGAVAAVAGPDLTALLQPVGEVLQARAGEELLDGAVLAGRGAQAHAVLLGDRGGRRVLGQRQGGVRRLRARGALRHAVGAQRVGPVRVLALLADDQQVRSQRRSAVRCAGCSSRSSPRRRRSAAPAPATPTAGTAPRWRSRRRPGGSAGCRSGSCRPAPRHRPAWSRRRSRRCRTAPGRHPGRSWWTPSPPCSPGRSGPAGCGPATPSRWAGWPSRSRRTHRADHPGAGRTDTSAYGAFAATFR